MQIELDEGELITMPPEGEYHGNIEVETIFRLTSYVKTHDLGRVYRGDTGFRPLSKRFALSTLLSSEGSASRRFAVRVSSKAPDLAVEILSPSDSFRQLTRKVKQHLGAGCHTVWVIHPERREVDVYGADGTDSELGVEDMLEAPELLPGLSFRVAELFD